MWVNLELFVDRMELKRILTVFMYSYGVYKVPLYMILYPTNVMCVMCYYLLLCMYETTIHT